MLIHATCHHRGANHRASIALANLIKTLQSYHHLILIPFRPASTTAFDGKTEFARSSTGSENAWKDERNSRRRQLLVRRNRSSDRRMRLHDKIRETYTYTRIDKLYIYIYIRVGCPGYKSTWNAAGVCVYFRSIWLKTGDKSSYRPRPKTKELWQPSFPSFLPVPRSATSPPFLTSSNLSYSHFLSVLFFTFLLLAAVIGFFLYTIGQYNRASSSSRIFGFHKMEKKAKRMKREKKRESP